MEAGGRAGLYVVQVEGHPSSRGEVLSLFPALQHLDTLTHAYIVDARSLKTEAREQKFKAILAYKQGSRAAWNMYVCFSKVGKHKQGQSDLRLIGVHLGTWQNIAATGGSVRDDRQGQEDLESSSPT